MFEAEARGREYLRSKGMEDRIIDFTNTDITAESTALALDVDVDRICKGLAFKGKNGTAIVVIASGRSRVDNGSARGYNLDFPDVIAVRDQLLPAATREQNIACDLNDFAWFDQIDATDGAVFVAAGVFYYFTTEQLKTLLTAMAQRFPGGVVAFDAVNSIGLKLMAKTVLQETGMDDIGAYFSVSDAPRELAPWSDHFASVTAKSYMNGYRPLGLRYGLLNALLAWLSDHLVHMSIVRVAFT